MRIPILALVLAACEPEPSDDEPTSLIEVPAEAGCDFESEYYDAQGELYGVVIGSYDSLGRQVSSIAETDLGSGELERYYEATWTYEGDTLVEYAEWLQGASTLQRWTAEAATDHVIERTTEVWSDGDDPQLSDIEVYEWSGEALTLIRADRGADGDDDVWTSLLTGHLAEGGWTTEDHVDHAPVDGVPESVEAWTYDDDWHALVGTWRDGIDAPVESEERWTWEGGVPVRWELSDGDGVVSYSCDYTWDGEELLDEYCLYADGDGWVWTYTYDDAGRVITATTVALEAGEDDVVVDEITVAWTCPGVI